MRGASLSRFLTFCLAAVSLATHAQKYSDAESLLSQMLRDAPESIASVLAHPDRHRVQILYTRVMRDEGEAPRFETHAFRSNSEYFYPASTVKFPTAVFALERLNELGVPRSAELRVEPASMRLPGTGKDAARSIAQYVHEIFVVSDNDAYNRLYEFLGPQAIEGRLRALQLEGTRIVHRLSVPTTAGENRIANASELWLEGRRVAILPERRAPLRVYEHLPLGSSYVDARGAVIDAPFNFGAKNAFPLDAQQALLREVFFPSPSLSLREEDLEFLHREMATLPRESLNPVYPLSEYPDSYAKFLLAGGEASLPEGVTIYNKIGQAYGFTTDNAYIVNPTLDVEFFLAATIYTNANNRFNDDDYEYDEVAIPFMRDLGRLVYEREVRLSSR
ncbi:MAG: serine hydrolase [Pseudomonadota bacterium]